MMILLMHQDSLQQHAIQTKFQKYQSTSAQNIGVWRLASLTGTVINVVICAAVQPVPDTNGTMGNYLHLAGIYYPNDGGSKDF